ncbi:hypothetical protein Tco_0133605 [Tanacetum coccineum]
MNIRNTREELHNFADEVHRMLTVIRHDIVKLIAFTGGSGSLTEAAQTSRDVDLNGLAARLGGTPIRDTHPTVTPQKYPQVQAPIVNNLAFWERLGSDNIGGSALILCSLLFTISRILMNSI